MADAVALALLVVLIVAVTAATTIVVRAAVKNRPKPEIPDSEKHRREFERTGDPAELDAMRQAIEREEGTCSGS